MLYRKYVHLKNGVKVDLLRYFEKKYFWDFDLIDEYQCIQQNLRCVLLVEPTVEIPTHKIADYIHAYKIRMSKINLQILILQIIHILQCLIFYEKIIFFKSPRIT